MRTFFQLILAIIVKPRDAFKKISEKKPWSQGIIILGITTVLGIIELTIGFPRNFGQSIGNPTLFVTLFELTLLFFVVIVHLWMRIFKHKGNILSILTSYLFIRFLSIISFFPVMFSSLIEQIFLEVLIRIIFGVWGIVLFFIALNVIYKIRLGKIIVTYALAFILITVIYGTLTVLINRFDFITAGDVEKKLSTLTLEKDELIKRKLKSSLEEILIINAYKNPRKIKGVYTLELKPFRILKIVGIINRKEDLKVWLSLIKEWCSQREVKITVRPRPDSLQEEEDHENIIAFWNFNKKTEYPKIQMEFEYFGYEVDYNIDPSKIGTYRKNSEEYKFYIKSENLVKITPEVRELASRIVGNEDNPYLQARKIFEWILDNMQYKYPPKGRGTEYLLSHPIKKGEKEYYIGDCGEYSYLFIALCRSLGIPARSVHGFWAIAGKEAPHAWAEFYLPNYGWVPVDASIADIIKELTPIFNILTDPDYYFGHLDNKRLIFSKGNDIQLEPSPHWGYKWWVHDGRAGILQVGIWNAVKIQNVKWELKITERRH